MAKGKGMHSLLALRSAVSAAASPLYSLTCYQGQGRPEVIGPPLYHGGFGVDDVPDEANPLP